MFIDDEIWKINQNNLNFIYQNNKIKEVFDDNSNIKDYLEKNIFKTIIPNDFEKKMNISVFDYFKSSELFFYSYNKAILSYKNCNFYQNIYLKFSIGKNFKDIKIIMLLTPNSDELILVGFIPKSEITKTSKNHLLNKGIGFLNNGRFIVNDEMLKEDEILKNKKILGKKIKIELIIMARCVEYKIFLDEQNIIIKKLKFLNFSEDFIPIIRMKGYLDIIEILDIIYKK